MADNDNKDLNKDLNDDSNQDSASGKPPDDKDMIERLVKERVESSLKDIKGKLDNAFKARDEALRKAAELEQQEKERQTKMLEEQGKYKELYEQHLAEKAAEIAALEKRNLELSRDSTVRDALKALPFRNANASDMAYKTIVDQLIRNDKGEWVHRTGISVEDFVESYQKDENNSFLFKAKINSGGGSEESTTGTPSTSKVKSLFEIPQDQVIKMAMEGKLPSRARR